MMFESVTGRRRRVNASKYIVQWEQPSRSKLQTSVKAILQEVWRGELVYEEFPVVGSKMTLDFYNATHDVAIEVDGKQHVEFNKLFHGNNLMNFLEQLKRDDKKEKFCENNGIRIYRVYEGEDLAVAIQKVLDDYKN